VLFGGMIALSLVPLLRYAQSSDDETPNGRSALPGARASVTALSPGARATEPSAAPVASGSTGEGSVGREQLIASLLSEGNHALDAKDIRDAERIFGHVLELAEDNPHAAHGLARIRLIQNNLSGAEGWIQLALRKRPRRAAYHALYAEVLSRMGRGNEAREELARAGVGRDSEAR
jgi:predicted Zn-dependent protease